MVDPQTFEPISTATFNKRNHGFNQNCINDLESAQRKPILDSGSTCTSLEKDFQVHWLQGDCHSVNIGLQNLEYLDYNDPELIAGVPIHLYDALRFDYE
ncbi:hypothetical protein L1049_006154 [Liquidambar formosana]|uniref:Uncharacterized protein n=1 Tax=Liquidambar formosana TaxID=63359 RepID=A0AAP0RGM9_LIQFO